LFVDDLQHVRRRLATGSLASSSRPGRQQDLGRYVVVARVVARHRARRTRRVRRRARLCLIVLQTHSCRPTTVTVCLSVHQPVCPSVDPLQTCTDHMLTVAVSLTPSVSIGRLLPTQSTEQLPQSLMRRARLSQAIGPLRPCVCVSASWYVHTAHITD